MPLSWNEIKDRALKFSKEWATETSEDAEAKSFSDGFSMSSACRAHAALDKAVDAAYGKKAYASDAERVAFLFELYREWLEPRNLS